MLCNRAIAQQLLGRYDDALASYAAAAAEPGSTAQELCTRAVARQQLGDYAGALADFAPACRHDPNHGIARRSNAFCRLLTGDFATGWRLHEARWDAADVTLHRRHAGRPQWTADAPLAGRTLLLHAEQGFGDTLQFCRYAERQAHHRAMQVERRRRLPSGDDAAHAAQRAEQLGQRSRRVEHDGGAAIVREALVPYDARHGPGRRAVPACRPAAARGLARAAAPSRRLRVGLACRAIRITRTTRTGR